MRLGLVVLRSNQLMADFFLPRDGTVSRLTATTLRDSVKKETASLLQCPPYGGYSRKSQGKPKRKSTNAGMGMAFIHQLLQELL